MLKFFLACLGLFGWQAISMAADTLRLDNGQPSFVFNYPDVYGDNFRNQRFSTRSACTVTGMLIAFASQGGTTHTTGDPDLVSLLWRSGDDLLPTGEPLLSDTMEYEEFSGQIFNLDSSWNAANARWVFVDFSPYGISFADSGEKFHLGYSAVLNTPDDTLALLADGGLPETDNASEWYNGSFVPMRQAWRGVNFFIRAVVETQSGIQVLSPLPENFVLFSAYPNPFNGGTTVSLEVSRPDEVEILIYDVLGRRVADVWRGRLDGGLHNFRVGSAAWSSGNYFVTLSTGSGSRTLRLMLEK